MLEEILHAVALLLHVSSQRIQDACLGLVQHLSDLFLMCRKLFVDVLLERG